MGVIDIVMNTVLHNNSINFCKQYTSPNEYLSMDAAKHLTYTGEWDICYYHQYPFNVLCNFYPTNYKFDNVQINSVEGFLQSLKSNNIDEQKKICGMFGKFAKKVGNYYRHCELYDGMNLSWLGTSFTRTSPYYQSLLNRIYTARYNNDGEFKKILDSSKPYLLTHKIGKKETSNTVLTENEFIQNLLNIRENNQTISKQNCSYDSTVNQFKNLENLCIPGLILIDNQRVVGPSIINPVCKQYLLQIKKSGVNTVIDLSEKSNNEKKELCQRFGIKYFNVPINTDHADTNQIIKNLSEYLHIMNTNRVYIEFQQDQRDADWAFALNYLFNKNAYIGDAVLFRRLGENSKFINYFKTLADKLPTNLQHQFNKKLTILKNMNY